MKLSEKILKLRKQNGLSQEELASKLNVSRQAVSRWELGSTQPDAPNLLKLSDLFGVSIDWLLREGDMAEETQQAQTVFQVKEERNYKGRKGFLVASIGFVMAGFAFLIAAIDRMDIILVLLTFADAALAAVFLGLYLKKETKK